MDTLTVGNRLILHLFAYIRRSENCIFPREMTSLGMSRTLDLGQTHVANELRKLALEDVVEVRREYVAGARGKKHVYVPTHKGRNLARLLFDNSRTAGPPENEDRGAIGPDDLDRTPVLGGDRQGDRDVSRVNTHFAQR